MNDFFSKSDEISAEVFWNNFDKVRKEQCYQLNGLCFASGVNLNTVRSAKSRNQMPLLSTSYALAKELGVSLEYLITGVEPSEKIPDDLQKVIDKYATKD